MNNKTTINKATINKETIYKATMILHALGDTIGFKNGDWEFNYQNLKFNPVVTLELIFEFISLGGVNGIDLKDWLVSDDTVLHMAIAKSLINDNVKFYESKDKLSRNQEIVIKNNMVKYLKNS